MGVKNEATELTLTQITAAVGDGRAFCKSDVTGLRIISARNATPKEREQYEEGI